MIIKIMPENDIERAKMKEVEHTGVKEFFIFGNKKDSESDLIDFHDWSGSYRYLVGSLYYFTGLLADEQAGKSANSPTEIRVNAVPSQLPAQAQKETPFIKRSGAQDGQIDGVVEVQDVVVDADKPEFKLVTNDDMEAEDEDRNDNSASVED